MDLISFIILCAIVGVLVWAITTYVPMPQPIKTLIIVSACLVLVLILLEALGIFNARIAIPRLRS
ncbi:hypothetical protein EPO05_06055 [Patescibacteria group bacterium]|nr:MAG: hypothetical protein EPO05_06055 [Patescibacteria group bacterium]